MFTKFTLKLCSAGHYRIISLISVALGFVLGFFIAANTIVGTVSAQASTNSIIATVKRPAANLRQGPGLQYLALGTLKHGGMLSVIGQFTNSVGEVWYEVYVPAFGNVWVASWVVRVNIAETEIPASNFSLPGEQVNTPISIPTISASTDDTHSGNGGNTNPSGPNNPPPPPPPATTPEP